MCNHRRLGSLALQLEKGAWLGRGDTDHHFGAIDRWRKFVWMVKPGPANFDLVQP